MSTRRRQRFVHAQAVWMLGALFVMAALGDLSLGRYLVASLFGLVFVLRLTAPDTLTPRWRSRLKWVVLLGVVGFLLVVVRRIVAAVPPGLI